MGIQWDSDRSKTILDIRKGGAGNPWQIFSLQGEGTAPSGGGQSVDSRWGRGANGQSEYIGAIKTSNPNRIDWDLMKRLSYTERDFIYRLTCPADVRVRQKCEDPKTLINYTALIEWLDGQITGESYSTPLAENSATPGDDVMDTLSMSFGFEQRMKKLIHLNVTGTNVDAVVNDVISVGLAQCPGDCGSEFTGEEEFWSCTNRDSTPGYLAQSTAQFGYTLDGGNTWSYSYIQPLQNADALSLVKLGERVFIASPGGGIVYARIQDIKDGVSLPWTRALAGGANGPHAIAVTPNGTLWAAGLNGYIYRSIDGGFTWTTFSAGTVTAVTLNDIAAASDDLVWFVGNTGVLLRYRGGVVSAVVSGITANINCVAVPPGREAELYFGSAAGRAYRSRNATATTPTITELALDQSGSGSIEELAFAGFHGDVLFILQSRADGKSRVIRDLSGGAGGLNQIEIIGSFDSPDNTGMNAIAPANQNYAVTVGELVGGYGWHGVLST